MTAPLQRIDDSLSRAWATTFLDLMNGRSERHSAIITIENRKSTSLEDSHIRDRLDFELSRNGKSSCRTVASTIFPRSMWNSKSTDDAKSLFLRYEKAWPSISRHPANRNGVYFRRLTAFQPQGRDPAISLPVNQLEFIAETFHQGNHRRSALQAAILDPTRDHTNHRRKGFPCLQQVAFTPLDQGGLSITGYYATQYQFEKAYGNYLGLYWLGEFMAHQLGLELRLITCFASLLSLGNQTKSSLQEFADDIAKLL